MSQHQDRFFEKLLENGFAYSSQMIKTTHSALLRDKEGRSKVAGAT